MASNINPYNIDGTFPIAGQDNSSQGFRDNFTNIKNNFTFATNEITDLQNKAIVTSALNGQTINNDMAGAIIRRPQLASWTQTLLDLGAISGGVTLDFNQANFQKITTAGSITLGLANWPTSIGTGALGYGLLRIWIVVTDASHRLILPSSVDITATDLAGYLGNQIVSFDAPGNYVFDLSSIDGGSNYLIFDVTRNRSTIRDTNLYFNPAVTATPTLFVGYGQNGAGSTGLNLAIAGDQGQNIVSSLGSYNSVAVGNLTLANLTSASLDTGKIGGYTLTAARGNLSLANVQPVHSGDYLGYINAVSYTGYNNTANTWQQLSSIAFFATGSNVAYGLGGNIAVFTGPDGDPGLHTVSQAMGIENDQSVRLYGNATIVGNLTTTGGRIEAGYQYSAATDSFQITASPNVSRLILDPAGTLANGNITLPTGNVDAKTITISSTATITALAVGGNSGTVVKPSANVTLAAGTAITYFYHDIEKTWYKIG